MYFLHKYRFDLRGKKGLKPINFTKMLTLITGMSDARYVAL